MNIASENNNDNQIIEEIIPLTPGNKKIENQIRFLAKEKIEKKIFGKVSKGIFFSKSSILLLTNMRLIVAKKLSHEQYSIIYIPLDSISQIHVSLISRNNYYDKSIYFTYADKTLRFIAYFTGVITDSDDEDYDKDMNSEFIDQIKQKCPQAIFTNNPNSTKRFVFLLIAFVVVIISSKGFITNSYQLAFALFLCLPTLYLLEMLYDLYLQSRNRPLSKDGKKELVKCLLIFTTIITLSISYYFFFLGPEKKFINCIKNAEKAWNDKDFNAVLKYANESMVLAKTNKQKSDSYYWRGIGYYRLGEYSNALNDEEESIRLNPKSSDPYVTIGAIKQSQGKLTEAIYYANKAMGLDSNNGWAYNLKASIFLEEGNCENAKANIQESLKIDPDNSIFIYNNKIISENCK